ncbi:TniQ protein [Clostridium cavendishii DSM 21758]|uniref:TniQ protein n=1 Tax=Clostridium cavendishii DSM 21758 TaxID=1121302 RepID=A0A1M6LVB7_9CLOT|nr:TnsD family Tn7-like transposition protein [Clostridium cavendishii]SHJ75177.1 TniQ protein [Clostridium cavendishii DSM 21758]
MLHFFTDPYKNELIYSSIARYHYYSGNIDYKDTLEELFGKRSIIPSLEIGSNIEQLANNLGEKYTAENIIMKHTVFPYYSPFLPTKRKTELLDEIKYKDGGGLYTKIGMVAGSICRKTSIYYCPCCAKGEIEKYGEVYIHREHQLQGVFICPHDGAELKQYSVDKTNSSRIEFIRLNKNLLEFRNIQIINNKQYDKLYKLAKDAYYLLEHDLSKISKERLLDKYKDILYAKALTTTTKRVKQQDLYEEFIAFYGKEFLDLMESNIDNDDEYNWLRVITRNLKRTVHPIRHLLLINFLDGDIEHFFSSFKDEFKPFGKGPWPCLNKASNQYRRNVVTDLKITEDYKTRVPVGTFKCECGFIYSRKGPDKTKDDRYKIGRIKAFGVVWETKLEEYLKDERYSLRELSRLMNCDPKTILKFKEKILNFAIKKDGEVEKNNKIIYKSEIYKSNLLKYIEVNKNATRTEIRKLCQKEYMYLYRRDKEWLYKQLPSLKMKENKTKVVDWNKRDREILTILKATYNKLINDKNPVRITKNILGKKTRLLAALDKNIDKLPKSKEYLNKILETKEEFQLRRCKNIIDSLINNNTEIRLWELQRKANVRKKDFTIIKDKILNYIEVKESGEKYEKESS